MNIQNDQVIFVPSDFSGLSDEVRRATLVYPPFAGNPLKALAAPVNILLLAAHRRFIKISSDTDPKVAEVLRKFSVATDAKRAAVGPLFTQILNTLNL